MVFITQRIDANVMAMSLNRYRSMIETLHLLSTPAKAAHLAKSITQHKAGKAVRRTLEKVWRL